MSTGMDADKEREFNSIKDINVMYFKTDKLSNWITFIKITTDNKFSVTGHRVGCFLRYHEHPEDYEV